jgi:hypothetical protein
MDKSYIRQWLTSRAFQVGAGLFSSLAIYLMVTSQIYIFPFQPIRKQLSASGSVPIWIELAGYPSLHRPEEALPFADLVVLAEITQINEARWNTADGLRPADWRPGLELTWMIYTPFKFRTVQVLKGGVADGLTSQFAVVGGQVGDDRVSVGESFDLYSHVVSGDQVLLFLRTSTGNMVNVAPYVYVDALRIDNDKATADCRGSRMVTDCRVVFNLTEVLAKIAPTR